MMWLVGLGLRQCGGALFMTWTGHQEALFTQRDCVTRCQLNLVHCGFENGVNLK